MKNERSNERALAAFIGEIGLALDYLNKLEAHLLDHMGTNPDEIMWTDAATAMHVKKELKEICDFLNLTEED